MLPGGLAPVSPGGVTRRQVVQVLPDGGPLGRGDAEPGRVTGALVHGETMGAQDPLELSADPLDRVIVEDPGHAVTFDLVAAMGLVAVPVPVDDLGIRPDGLAAALARGAGALILTPRAHPAVRAGGARDHGQRTVGLHLLGTRRRRGRGRGRAGPGGDPPGSPREDMAAAGWAVAPGQRFRIAAPPGVRICFARLAEADAPSFAADLARALRHRASRLD